MKRKPFILRLRDFPLRRVSRVAFHAVLQSQKFFRHIGAQPGTRIRWDEFRNKLRAFLAFEYADLRLGLSPRPRLPLNQLVSNAERLGSHLSPFVVEGIGYHLAKSNLPYNVLPHRMPFLQTLPGVPQRSLVPLHAGSGLALAESWLSAIDAQRPCNQISFPGHFPNLCRQNSLPGYAGIALEALGFVASTIYPHLIDLIDRSLSSNEECLAYFWRGVGRGTYFAPVNASPFRSAPWKAIEMCLHAPHQLGRQNAVAGLAGALTIINIGQPQIMATFLKHHATGLTKDEGFTSGVRSAAMIWRHVSPEDTRLETLPRFLPAHRELISHEVWNQFVECPLMDALRQDSSVEAKPEKLFRYI